MIQLGYIQLYNESVNVSLVSATLLKIMLAIILMIKLARLAMVLMIVL